MRKLTVTLAFLAAAAGLGTACSSDSGDDTGGLTGGVTGKGGAGPGAGGTGATGATSGNSNSGGTGNVIITTGGSSGTAGSSSGSSGSSGASSGGTGATDCTGTMATGQKGKGATVLFLVDTSGSMAERPTSGGRGGMFGGGAGQTKMALTQTALNQAFGNLSSGLNVGMIFFPHVAQGATPCFDPTVEVPIAQLDGMQLMTLQTAVTGARPDGGTPTHDAFAFAVETLKASTAPGDKYIVLITDGKPTYALGCMGNGMPDQDPPIPEQPLIDAAQAAFTTDGIKTFVVGSPGSEDARDTLSAMARVGGTGPTGCADTGTPAYCHFDMTTTMDFGASLSMALGEITAQIPVDCAFDLPRPPAGMDLDLGLVNVTLTDEGGTKTPIAKDPAGDCATDGWVYVGEPPTQVKLCGALCDSVNASMGMPTIDVQFGCSTRVNPPK